MKVWLMQGSYEGESFTSVHFTEKGCALACVAEVLEFLEVHDKETALNAMQARYFGSESSLKDMEPIEWDFDKLKDMPRKDLWKVFSDWTETCWEQLVDRSYYIDATTQMIHP